MKKIILILIFLFLCNPAFAFEDWDKMDYTLLGTSTVLQVMDWRQTRYFVNYPEKYYEINPILGKHPSSSEVDLYFAGSFILKLGIAYILPSKWRKIWLGGLTILSGACVINNHSIGINIRW